LKKVTNYWYDEYGNHVDVIKGGIPYCASCWIEKFGE